MHDDQRAPRLEFLDAFRASRSHSYREAPWLKSSARDPVWICQAKGFPQEISWQVPLSDGSLLTAKKNAGLKDALGCILTVQSHPDASARGFLAPNTLSQRLGNAGRIVDWILVNGSSLEIEKHGLHAMTQEDVRHLIRDLASSAWAWDSVYRWRSVLTAYLLNGISESDPAAISVVLEANPEMAKLSEDTPRLLSLSDDEIPKARAFLQLQNLYRFYTISSVSFRYTPNNPQLVDILYPHTLFARRLVMPIAQELCFRPSTSRNRELDQAPVRSNGKLPTEKTHDGYKRVLKSIELLVRTDVAMSSALLTCSEVFPYFDCLDRRELGRYASLPVPIVMGALKSAIEFYLTYSSSLVSCVSRAVHIARAEKVISLQDIDPARYVDELLQSAGVVRWSSSQGGDGHSRFDRLRSNDGLRQMLLVMIGSILIVVGTLSARRRAELEALLVGTALHRGGRHLQFYNCKSGPVGTREKLIRPLADVAIDMIKLLEQMQKTITGKSLDVIPLFALPGRNGLTVGLPITTRALDAFCDYFKIGQDHLGRRHYIRQHQLRRFFAMTFFWSHSFGGLDTLRWFLGHSDPEHVYRYISEALGSKELNAVKADYVIERMKNADEQSPLTEFLAERFGATSLSILSSTELRDFVELCVAEGKLVVEPEFISGSDGKSYRILVLVKDKEAT